MKKVFEISVRKGGLGLMLMLIACAFTIQAQNELVGGVGITLFDKTDFRGKAVTFRQEVYDLKGRGFNDRTTSIRVGPGEQWEVCEDANFRGQCVVISGEERDLAKNDWDNKISSLRPVGGGGGGGPAPAPGGGYIVLFTGADYWGYSGTYRTAVAILKMNARSVKVGQGTWQICDGLRFTGRCITLSQDVPNLAPLNIGRPIRSLRPVGFVPLPAPVPPANDPYIVLFDQTNYRGSPTNYKRTEANIAKRVRSVTIGRGVWELCDRRDFTGRCQTLSQSTPDLRVFSIGSTIRSVRPVGPQPR